MLIGWGRFLASHQSRVNDVQWVNTDSDLVEPAVTPRSLTKTSHFLPGVYRPWRGVQSKLQQKLTMAALEWDGVPGSHQGGMSGAH